MGKKRIIKKAGSSVDQGMKDRSLARASKRKITTGIVQVRSTYNNTAISLTDSTGNTVFWSTSGALGFKGAKKGTPYASAKIAELIVEKAKSIGVKDVDVIIKGVGSGRESAIRTIAAKGIIINKITDTTPVPHNGPRPRKPRRV